MTYLPPYTDISRTAQLHPPQEKLTHTRHPSYPATRENNNNNQGSLGNGNLCPASLRSTVLYLGSHHPATGETLRLPPPIGPLLVG